MLDDVFAELDAKRRGHLVEMISGYEQILITSAVEEDVPQSLRGQVFDVAGGVVTPRLQIQRPPRCIADCARNLVVIVALLAQASPRHIQFLSETAATHSLSLTPWAF